MKEPSTNCYLDWNLSQITFCTRHWLWKELSLISFIFEEGSQTYFPKCNYSTYIDLSQPILELLYLRQKVLAVLPSTMEVFSLFFSSTNCSISFLRSSWFKLQASKASLTNSDTPGLVEISSSSCNKTVLYKLILKVRHRMAPI